jgi:hypothetical protein
MAEAPTLLAATFRERRVTIGVETPEELRALSDRRELSCPGCGAVVVLHAGSVRAHHFAHLPGAVCTLPVPEPETEEHRAGKLLIAAWLRIAIPNAEVIVEAPIAETGQRADVLLLTHDPERRVAIEFQCANLSLPEWRRRHRAYRDAGILDLWLLGGSRLAILETGSDGKVHIRGSDLERAVATAGAPLLFLSSLNAPEADAAGTLVRLRPTRDAPPGKLSGDLVRNALERLAFPWHLLDWPERAPTPPEPSAGSRRSGRPHVPEPDETSEEALWEWLKVRHRATREALSALFGLDLPGASAFACSPQAWQATIYYRFVHGRINEGWWLSQIETWCRAHLPLNGKPSPATLRRALSALQQIFAAAGFLSLPMGYGRVSARVLADLTTLPAPPDPENVQRIARYRRTLVRDARADYEANRK